MGALDEAAGIETDSETGIGIGAKQAAVTMGVGGEVEGVETEVAIAIAETTADAGLASPELVDELWAEIGPSTGVIGEEGERTEPPSDMGV